MKAINPDLVIVNGTRIISKKVLSSINSKFVNIHVGITQNIEVYTELMGTSE
jgi:folate-dependent phosphoribosylglycinamide formyltransferase PurN